MTSIGLPQGRRPTKVWEDGGNWREKPSADAGLRAGQRLGQTEVTARGYDLDGRLDQPRAQSLRASAIAALEGVGAGACHCKRRSTNAIHTNP
jgi:hypothetical protein